MHWSFLRHTALAVFFAALMALEIGHGIFRIETIRSRHRTLTLEEIERKTVELAGRLGSYLAEGMQHPAYLARSPAVRSVLLAGGDSQARRAARKELETQLLPYLVTFRAIDRVRIFGRDGAELFRSERIGSGVGSLPEALLGGPDARGLEHWPREPRGDEVLVSDLVTDSERVEVPETDRQVLHYRAAVHDGGERIGDVVLTIYAAPVLDLVRRFAPISGARSMLVDTEGRYLAHTDRRLERGQEGARSLIAEFPPARSLLAGAPRTDGDGMTVLARPASSEPEWHLVAQVPAEALERASAHLRNEYAWVIGSMLAITAVLGAAAVFFVRMSMREVRLEEGKRKRKLERQLQVSERLGSLGLLTAGVAHEINNPLEGIGNYLALLERDGLPEPQRKRYLELVRHGLGRIRDIVRDLSTFARPAIHTGVADLEEVVQRALKMLAYSRDFKGVAADTSGLVGPLLVSGDTGRLEQVFINLLHNAGRAMGGRGSVAVRARRSEMHADGAPFLEVTVEDHGPGIPESILGRIFDPFFTTTHGTGLGLSISYGIVEAHGGSITAANRPEGGARFTLRLPAATEEHAARPVARKQA